jgi:hypothetical protein
MISAMRRWIVALALIASLGYAERAAAAEVIALDDQGRAIRFDVRVDKVDAEWYARLLRAAPHGDEVSTVRIVIVSPSELVSTCGADAAGCYSRNVITVPAEESERNAHAVVHEYGHHLDRSKPIAGIAEPNGTSVWWRARGMAQLLRLGSVAPNYIIGWDRSIAEIFAEDYAQLVLPGSPYAIRWLDPPNDIVIAALKADFGLGPEPEIPNPPPPKPVVVSRSGSLPAGKRTAIPFGLLGPGRRLQATATFGGVTAKMPRATLEVRCDGRRLALKTIVRGTTSVTIERSNIGPAQCTATLASKSGISRSFTLTVRLSLAA